MRNARHAVMTCMSCEPESHEQQRRCVVCGEQLEIEAGHYRIGDALVHPDCIRSFWHPSQSASFWPEERVSFKREIGGGSAASPWTLLFDDGIARRAAQDSMAFKGLLIASAETMFTVAATRRTAAVLRRDSKRVRARSHAATRQPRHHLR